MTIDNALAELVRAAREVEENVKHLQEYLGKTENGKIPPATGGPHTGVAGSLRIPVDAPKSIIASKSALLEATTIIEQLLMAPFDFQRQQAMNNQYAASIRWLCYFKIPDHVPEAASITFSNLAAATSLPEDTLSRICMLAATAGFFHCPDATAVAHTPISFGYRSPAPQLETMLFLTETAMPTAYKMVEMTLSQISGGAEKTAFQIAHDTDLGFFPYLSKNPVIGKRLASGMKDFSAAAETHVQHLIDGYDWQKASHVVDIGGSTGHASIALARAFPQLFCTVQDLPPIIAQAEKQKLDPEVAGRIKFEAHSFLLPQPASSATADIYLIRQCLQNHPHATVVQILRNLIPCLDKPHARLIINNIVIPEPGNGRIGIREQAALRTRDLFMMQAMNGGERDLAQWKQLLRDADTRLELVNVVIPEGSELGVLEVRLRTADKH